VFLLRVWSCHIIAGVCVCLCTADIVDVIEDEDWFECDVSVE